MTPSSSATSGGGLAAKACMVISNHSAPASPAPDAQSLGEVAGSPSCTQLLQLLGLNELPQGWCQHRGSRAQHRGISSVR